MNYVLFFEIGVVQLLASPFVLIEKMVYGSDNYSIKYYNSERTESITTNVTTLAIIESLDEECADYKFLSFASKKTIIADGSTAAPISDFDLKKCPIKINIVPAGTELKIEKFASLTYIPYPSEFRIFGNDDFTYYIVSDKGGNRYDIAQRDFNLLKKVNDYGNNFGYFTKENLDWNELLGKVYTLCSANRNFKKKFEKFNIKYKIVKTELACSSLKFDDVDSLKIATATHRLRIKSDL